MHNELSETGIQLPYSRLVPCKPGIQGKLNRWTQPDDCNLLRRRHTCDSPIGHAGLALHWKWQSIVACNARETLIEPLITKQCKHMAINMGRLETRAQSALHLRSHLQLELGELRTACECPYIAMKVTILVNEATYF